MTKIPHQIFYVWDGDKSNFVHSCIVSWKIFNPDFKIIEINNKHRLYKKAIKNNAFFRYCAERKIFAPMADVLRLMALYEYGGVYCDVDIQIIKPLETLMHSNFIGIEDTNKVNAAIMGFERKHPLIKAALDYYTNDVMKADNFIIPVVINEIAQKLYGEEKYLPNKKYIYKNLTIYPREYFYPFYFNEKFNLNCLTPNTYSIHWWRGSWSNKDTVEYLSNRANVQEQPAIKYYPKWIVRLICCFIPLKKHRKEFRQKHLKK